MKKALCIATVASNLDNFNRNNVKILKELGYEVTLASNFSSDEDTNSQEKVDEFRQEMEDQGLNIRQIDFARSVSRIRQHIRSFDQIKKLLKEEHFDLIHCHSPICAFLTRIAARKYRKNNGTKVLYTAHGFHFYKGAPIQNWLLFYPMEWLMSWVTDVQITINTQDYHLAKKRFHAKDTRYIHGIGVDTTVFQKSQKTPEEIRSELGLSDDNIMLLSVGEINVNKNQASVIRALSEINDHRLHYVLAGIGNKMEEDQQLAKDMNLQDKIHFLGFRNDIPDLCHAADLFIFPSYREGLSVALMEALASGTPVLCGKIRGNEDLVTEKECLFNPKDLNSIVKCIRSATDHMDSKDIKTAFSETVASHKYTLENYDVFQVDKEMKQIYISV